MDGNRKSIDQQALYQLMRAGLVKGTKINVTEYRRYWNKEDSRYVVFFANEADETTYWKIDKQYLDMLEMRFQADMVEKVHRMQKQIYMMYVLMITIIVMFLLMVII